MVAEAVSFMHLPEKLPVGSDQAGLLGKFPMRSGKRVTVVVVNSSTGQSPLGRTVRVYPLPGQHDTAAIVHREHCDRTRGHHVHISVTTAVGTHYRVVSHIEPRRGVLDLAVTALPRRNVRLAAGPRICRHIRHRTTWIP